jgi:pimeloyl-ACP methyl ester carboxylesterase
MDPLDPSEGETIAELPETPAAHTGVGGPALRFRVWTEPEGAEPRATLAVLSGVMSNTAWFRPLAERWRAMGYRVVGLERRGSGLNWAPGAEDVPSARDLEQDAIRELTSADGMAPGRPVVIVGWCWGAILGVQLALALGADRVDGLALLAPGLHPSPALVERMRALQEQAKAAAPDEPVLESPITDEMFTQGPMLDAFVRRDEARWRRFSPRFLDVSTRLSLAARMRLRKLTIPVFVALADDDVTTDNAAILAELARLPADRVRTTRLPGPHGLQFDAPEALSERLDAWARDALGV